MNHRLRPVGFALAVLGIAGAAHADDAAVRKELDRDYATLCRAMMRKDAKPILALGTEDMVLKEHGRIIKGEALRKDLVQQLAMLKSVRSVTMNITKLSVHGKKAVALVHYTSTADIGGKDGKTHLMRYSGATRDTWVKLPVGWRLSLEEALQENMTLDGKPMPSSAPPSSGE